MIAEAIAGHCAGSGIDVEVVAQTGSTNADLLAQLPFPTHRLLIALSQTAGRGRAGRSWLSGDDSLTFSLAWRFALPLQALAGLPLAVGVALAEALGELGVKVQLKWPNDVLKDGAKLAGVLIETRVHGPGELWAVIGIGMNLLMPDALEQQIGRPAAGAPWLAGMDRNALMGKLVNHLAACMTQFEQHGFAAFAARWNRLHAYQGCAVSIIDAGVVLERGTAAGVDDGGVLLLDTAAGRVAVLAGDVSLRPLEAPCS